jgi:hypothetical protein
MFGLTHRIGSPIRTMEIDMKILACIELWGVNTVTARCRF